MNKYKTHPLIYSDIVELIKGNNLWGEYYSEITIALGLLRNYQKETLDAHLSNWVKELEDGKLEIPFDLPNYWESQLDEVCLFIICNNLPQTKATISEQQLRKYIKTQK